MSSPRKQPAGEAARAALQKLFAAMQRHEPGLRVDRDPEDLHRFRVAVRRTRSCIGQMKSALPAGSVAPFTPEFAWLGAVTGPTRDLDVLLENLPRYLRREDVAERDVEPFVALVRGDKRAAHERMIACLETERYRSLLAGWNAFLDAPWDVSGTADGGRPIVEVAVERIGRRFARVIRRGRKLDAEKETKKLHRLRIEGKKLRYLLELFRGALDEGACRPLIASLKVLQDLLGEFNDLVIQQDALSGMIPRLEAAQAGTAARVAVERLREQLALRERRVRRRFAGEFRRFDTEETARRVAGLGRIPEGSS